ncbi:MAG: DUF5011 domain-containing protein [Bacteroidales bacterium]|nr:DUF5011 domain-containing protein [Bacteroidales bacterium]
MIKRLLTYGLLVLILVSCEKWYYTDNVSHVSYLPEFEMEGGDFLSYIQNDTAEFEDPGVTAWSGDEELVVYADGEVDLSHPGVYAINYYAQNEDKLIGMGRRIVAVTYEDVSDNDLSGTYEGTNWEPVESKVRKVNENGLYDCEEVMGYYDLEMEGSFVDLGENKLMLIDGEGYFGHYAASGGEYTLSTLSWTIYLLDEPNDGIQIPVIWRKKE